MDLKCRGVRAPALAQNRAHPMLFGSCRWFDSAMNIELKIAGVMDRRHPPHIFLNTAAKTRPRLPIMVWR